jgi:hypothetical protein
MSSERDGPNSLAGPFVNLSQVYCNGLDVLAKSSEPVMKAAGRVNLEMLTLATRRTRAWLELPARAAQCKSPQDLLREQLHFWQTAAFDYGEAARRAATAFGALHPAALSGAWPGAAKPPFRDYIKVPDTGQPRETPAPPRERRAA